MILDTNGLSAVAEGERPLNRSFAKPQGASFCDRLGVLGEYRYGIVESRERNRYEQWLSEFLPKFRILDIDERTTMSYAA